MAVNAEQNKPLKIGEQVQNKPIQEPEIKIDALTVEKVAKLEVPEEKLFDADLIAGSYTLELINHIRKHQFYPKKALREGIEGSLTLLITINASGEISHNKFIQRSGKRILDRAVIKIIRKAQPFPSIPKELDQQEFEFEVDRKSVV